MIFKLIGMHLHTTIQNPVKWRLTCWEEECCISCFIGDMRVGVSSGSSRLARAKGSAWVITCGRHASFCTTFAKTLGWSPHLTPSRSPATGTAPAATQTSAQRRWERTVDWSEYWSSLVHLGSRFRKLRNDLSLSKSTVKFYDKKKSSEYIMSLVSIIMALWWTKDLSKLRKSVCYSSILHQNYFLSSARPK